MPDCVSGMKELFIINKCEVFKFHCFNVMIFNPVDENLSSCFSPQCLTVVVVDFCNIVLFFISF